MAFTGNYMPTSFKAEVLRAVHNFTASTGNVFKLALYTNTASFTAATTAYTATNEVTGTGYTAGGGTLTNITPVTDGTAGVVDFADLTFTSATITARGGMIYNNTAAGTPSCAILDFGEDKVASGGDFAIIFPAATAAAAIIRFA